MWGANLFAFAAAEAAAAAAGVLCAHLKRAELAACWRGARSLDSLTRGGGAWDETPSPRTHTRTHTGLFFLWLLAFSLPLPLAASTSLSLSFPILLGLEKCGPIERVRPSKPPPNAGCAHTHKEEAEESNEPPWR